MKVNTYEYPKSSFLGIAKDTAEIMDLILGNQNVLKLLYYTANDVLIAPKKDLTSSQIREMFTSKQISNIPKLIVNKDIKTYLRITFGDFVRSATNDFYRDSVIEVKIACHFDVWDLNDFELRPYRIAGEIDSMLDGVRLSGIGLLRFISGDQDIYDEHFGGVTLRYLAVRGHEDDINPLGEQ